MAIEVKILGAADDSALSNIAASVFDKPIDPQLATEFLTDPRHHIAIAIEDGLVVGFVSAVHYVHPDKPTELWINEVAVAPSHHRRGIGQCTLRAMLGHGRALGCQQAWVLTNRSNEAAVALYSSVGGTTGASDEVMFTFDLEAGGVG